MKRKLAAVVVCIGIILTSIPMMVPSNRASKGTRTVLQLNTYQKGFSETDFKDTQLSFAALTDTHIGAKYQDPFFDVADHLDRLGDDLVNATNTLDFVVHLGDIVNHNTAQVNGEGLPKLVNQYKNNLKAYLISHLNLPFFYVVGNHDVTDYQMNQGNPHNLTQSLVDELSQNSLIYAMMYNGILFLVVPELGSITWTHPVEYQWIEYMTHQYPTTTTIIFCHQTIEDTTTEESALPYRGKQDRDWWANLFQHNQQIKMWIHGHNHWLDWYLNNQSTGMTNPIQYFGHEMAFSSPYPQMNWEYRNELDRTVIYNITATSISTATWENNGAAGHWVSDYRHSWNISTTFSTEAENWYSVPVFLQDNETQTMDMKMLSPNITLHLIGTEPMELFFDSKMESPNGSRKENILGFGNDQVGNVCWTDPGMRVSGPTILTFPEKYPDNTSIQEDGRSGQPYRSFPMGTIGAAIPGQSYTVTITARCLSGYGRLIVNSSCSDWETKSQYSTLPESDQQIISHTFGAAYETIQGVYTVPDNINAWFLQGTLQFLDATEYDVLLFSVKRQQMSDMTENFHLSLSGHWYNDTGSLAENEQRNFSLNPQDLCNHDGIMNFTAFIQGNRYGIATLVYHEPLLLGMNARFRINSEMEGVYNLSLTKTISRNSAEKMIFWDSTLFQKHPQITELVLRFLLIGVPDNILSWILNKGHPGISTTFKMFPFSMNPLYQQMNFTSEDGSGTTHRTGNGNLWFSCNSPNTEERNITIKFPS